MSSSHDMLLAITRVHPIWASIPTEAYLPRNLAIVIFYSGSCSSVLEVHRFPYSLAFCATRYFSGEVREINGRIFTRVHSEISFYLIFYSKELELIPGLIELNR